MEGRAMNIFKRKAPIVADIPPRPEDLEVWLVRPYRDRNMVGAAETISGRVAYPIYRAGCVAGYAPTKRKAQSHCKKLNVLIDAHNGKIAEHNRLLSEERNKEIAEWDKKYGR